MMSVLLGDREGETHRDQRRPCEERGRDWVLWPPPRSSWNPQELGEAGGPYPRACRGSAALGHLDIGLLASELLRRHISDAFNPAGTWSLSTATPGRYTGLCTIISTLSPELGGCFSQVGA